MISRPPHSAIFAVAELSGEAKQTRHADLHQRHQAQGGRKRHLEAWMHQRFRRDCQHDHRRYRQRPERHGAAVDHDRDQNHRRHEERALGRYFRAGQQQIERSGGKGCGRRPFLDRKADGERRDQRQQCADRKEHYAGNDGHVIAGNREHVSKPRDKHRIVDGRRDRVAAAGQKRRRNGPLVAIQRGSNARIDRIAQTLHDGRIAPRQAATDRRLQGLDGAGDKAGGADALEIHVAAEIVRARPQRCQRRLQPRLQCDEAADIGRGALAHRQANALQPDATARDLHLRHPQHEAIGALAHIARLDEAR
jgi:hypothetical protein